MSAYIVANRTINRVITALDNDRNNTHVKGKICFLGFVGEFGESLGKAMLALNKRAVDYRYDGDEDVESYQYRIELCGTMQALKSLRCWLYQCSEGNIPEDPLFMAMEELAAAWSYDIVSQLPAWDVAQWG